MTLQRQLIFWLAALAGLTVVLVLLSDMLLPFIAGFALAYFLDPVADRLERLGVPRILATAIILGGFLGIFVTLAILFVPALATQFWAFVQEIPRLVDALVERIPTRFVDWARANLGTEGRTVGQFAGEGAAWFGSVIGSLWSGGQRLVTVVAFVVLAPVVAFYMLIDWDRMIDTVDSWIPLHQRATVEELAREIDRAVAGFVRGQALVCFLLGSFYAIALSIVGLNFGLLIGLAAGFLSFIPFVGSTTGLVLSGGVALVQFWSDWVMIGAVLAIFAFGQFIEGNVLQPRLVGRSVGLHPVWLIFALLAFTYLFGFVGALLAVPIAAALGVVVRFALRQYLASPLYTGEPPEPHPPLPVGSLAPLPPGGAAPDPRTPPETKRASRG